MDAHQIERVRDRIGQYMADEAGCVIDKHLTAEDLNLAARVLAAYAATLPREVEIERWAVIDATGDIRGLCLSEDAARCFISRDGDQVVRLAGKATLPPREKVGK
jgi:hypothetical protein